MENQELATVLKEEEVSKSTADQIQQSFQSFLDQSKEWEEKAKSIKVTSVDQKEEMKQAREARLALKKIRVNADKTRKELKAESLRYSKAVQGVYNIIEYKVKPIENYLEEQEKFAEREAARIRLELKDKRLVELTPYESFVPMGIDFGSISEEDYQKIFVSAKNQFESELKRIEDEKKAAELKQKLDNLERDRKLAIAPYSEYLPENLENLREMTQDRFEKLLEDLKDKKKEDDEAKELLRIENEKLVRQQAEQARQLEEERRIREEQALAERRERERIEAELKAQKEEQERIERQRIEAENAEKLRIEAEKRAKELAPDKDKLEALAKSIDSIEMPNLSDDAAQKVLTNTKSLLAKVSAYIRQNIETL